MDKDLNISQFMVHALDNCLNVDMSQSYLDTDNPFIEDRTRLFFEYWTASRKALVEINNLKNDLRKVVVMELDNKKGEWPGYYHEFYPKIISSSEGTRSDPYAVIEVDNNLRTVFIGDFYFVD